MRTGTGLAGKVISELYSVLFHGEADLISTEKCAAGIQHKRDLADGSEAEERRGQEWGYLGRLPAGGGISGMT